MLHVVRIVLAAALVIQPLDAWANSASLLPVNLINFKAQANKRLAAMGSLCRLKGTDLRYYEISRPTFLMLTGSANDVENVELDGTSSDLNQFWQCADAVLFALTPSESALQRNKLLRSFRTAPKVDYLKESFVKEARARS